MIRNMTEIDWTDATEYVPAVVLAVALLAVLFVVKIVFLGT